VPVAASQIRIVLSMEPVARRVPSGDHATEYSSASSRRRPRPAASGKAMKQGAGERPAVLGGSVEPEVQEPVGGVALEVHVDLAGVDGGGGGVVTGQVEVEPDVPQRHWGGVRARRGERDGCSAWRRGHRVRLVQLRVEGLRGALVDGTGVREPAVGVDGEDRAVGVVGGRGGGDDEVAVGVGETVFGAQGAADSGRDFSGDAIFAARKLRRYASSPSLLAHET
jgi:hypothetical protein